MLIKHFRYSSVQNVDSMTPELREPCCLTFVSRSFIGGLVQQPGNVFAGRCRIEDVFCLDALSGSCILPIADTHKVCELVKIFQPNAA